MPEAIASFRRAVELRPDPVLHTSLGQVYSRSRRDGCMDLEAEQYRCAIERDPDCAEAWRCLSDLRLYQGRIEEAEAAARRAVESAPDAPRCHYQLALVHFFSGSSDAARRCFADSNKLAVARWSGLLDGPQQPANREWFAVPTAARLIHDWGGGDRSYGQPKPHVLREPSWPLPCLQFRESATYHVTLEDVKLEGLSGLVYDDRRVFASEHIMLQGVWRVFTETPPQHPRQETTLPEIVSIAQPDITNYYHWTAECLSRLMALEELLDSDRSLKILVPNVRSSSPQGDPHFVEQALDLLGIDRSRRLLDQAGPAHVYRARKVHYADWNAPLSAAPAPEIAAAWYPPQTWLRRVRERLADPMSPTERRAVIYTGRSDPRAARAVLGEVELIEELKRIVGADLVVLGNPSPPLAKQIELFRCARLVIGPHGAGLTNLVFCAPGTRVIEFPVVPTVLNHYGHLSMALDLEYWQVPELATHYHGQYRIDSHSLRAVLETVEACLR